MSHEIPPPPSVAAPLCLIYLPPILAIHPEAELDRVGEKLAVAIDHQASVGAHVYRTVSEFIEVRGKKERVCRILRMDPAGSNHHPLADLFMVDYRPSLLHRYRDAILAKKCVLAGIGLCEMVWRTMTCEIGRDKRRLLSLRERVQSVVVLAILAQLLCRICLQKAIKSPYSTISCMDKIALPKCAGTLISPWCVVTYELQRRFVLY